jgi:hypothetical protein
MEIIFKCDIPLCYGSTVYKIRIIKKTQLYLGNRICVSKRSKCSDLGYVILMLKPVQKKRTEDDKVP